MLAAYAEEITRLQNVITKDIARRYQLSQHIVALQLTLVVWRAKQVTRASTNCCQGYTGSPLATIC